GCMSVQTRVNMALLKLFRTKELCGVTADAKTHLVKPGLDLRGELQDFKSNNLSNGEVSNNESDITCVRTQQSDWN
ncbi:8955_t:CDS:2, partial [Gigaspora margarita]